MTLFKSSIIIIVLSVMFLFAEVPQEVQQFDSAAVYMKNSVYPLKIELYEIYKKIPCDIVMLGDSRTDGVNWNELLGRPNIISRGIPSDVTEGFVARLDYVYNLEPRYCIIQGGLNDIYNWTPVEKIYQNYVKIIGGLRSKGIKPILQSVIYAGKVWGKDYLVRTNSKLKAEDVNKERNQEIQKLNKMLKSYAKRNDIIYVELNDEMSFRGLLKDDLTRDGVHLNAKGYKIWGRKLDAVLTELGL